MKALLAAAAFAAAAVVYYATLAPALMVGDEGEQIAAAHVLGISHPTGTPLYLLLMKGWELIIPFGSVVWRMNLLNAVLGAFTTACSACLLYHAGCRLGVSNFLSLAAAFGLALCFALSRSFWAESVAASSYVLHMLFVVLWCLFAAEIARSPKGSCKRLYLLLGFSLANHVLSLVLLGATWLLSIWQIRRRKIGLAFIAYCHIFLIPGLLFYSYIPIRASADPAINWGKPSSFFSFWDYISRTDYHAKSWVESLSDFVGVLEFQTGGLLDEFGLVFCIVAVFCLALLPCMGPTPKEIREERNLWILLGILLVVLNSVLVALHGSYADLFYWKRYFLTAHFGLFLIGSVGVLSVLRFVESQGRVFGIICGLLIVGTAAYLPYASNYFVNDQSRNTLLQRYIENVLSYVPEHSTLFAQGDNHLFGLVYYCVVEGKRPDLNLVNKELGLGDEAKAARDLRSGRYFSTHYIDVPRPFQLRRRGLVFEVFLEGPAEPVDVEWSDFRLPDERKALAPLEEGLATTYLLRRARFHLERNEPELARKFIQRMPHYASRFVPSLLSTGYAFRELGEDDKAQAFFLQAHNLNPKDPRASNALK